MRRSTVPCSVRMRSAEREPARRCASAGAFAAIVSASGQRRAAVVARAGEDRHESGPLPALSRSASVLRMPRRAAVGARLGQHHAFRLDRGQRAAGASAQVGFDDREGAGRRAAPRRDPPRGLSATTTNGPCSAMAGREH